MATDSAPTLRAMIETELASIEAKLGDYDALVKRRTQLRAMLEIEAGEVAIAAPSAAKPSARRSRGKASGSRNGGVPADQRAERVLAFIAAHPEGTTNVAVAKELGVANGTATKVVSALLESGKLRAEGERAARRLYAGKA